MYQQYVYCPFAANGQDCKDSTLKTIVGIYRDKGAVVLDWTSNDCLAGLEPTDTLIIVGHGHIDQTRLYESRHDNSVYIDNNVLADQLRTFGLPVDHVWIRIFGCESFNVARALAMDLGTTRTRIAVGGYLAEIAKVPNHRTLLLIGSKYDPTPNWTNSRWIAWFNAKGDPFEWKPRPNGYGGELWTGTIPPNPRHEKTPTKYDNTEYYRHVAPKGGAPPNNMTPFPQAVQMFPLPATPTNNTNNNLVQSNVNNTYMPQPIAFVPGGTLDQELANGNPFTHYAIGNVNQSPYIFDDHDFD